jgi:hypothetical protein
MSPQRKPATTRPVAKSAGESPEAGAKPEKVAKKPQRLQVRYVIQRAHEHLGPDGRVAQKDIVATVVHESESPVWGGELTITIRSPELAAAFELGKEFTVEYEVQT